MPGPKSRARPAQRKAPARPRRTTPAKQHTPASRAHLQKQVAYKAVTKSMAPKSRPAAPATVKPAMPPKRNVKGPGGYIGEAHQSFFDIGKFLKSLGGGGS